MHIPYLHLSQKHLTSRKFLCKSLFLSTAWLLCDISTTHVFAETTGDAVAKEHVETTNEKLDDSKTQEKAEKSSEENKSKESKDERKVEENEFKPVFSKDIYNVLNMPDTSIDDFSEITKKIGKDIDNDLHHVRHALLIGNFDRGDH